MATRSSDLTQQARAAWDRLRWGLGALRLALLARGLWLAPTTLVVDTDGKHWQVNGAHMRPRRGGRASGVLMGTRACLWGTLDLPQMPRRSLDGAVHEALWRVSPLPLEQVLCAWTVRPASPGLTGWQADWGLCPEAAVQEARQQAGLDAAAPVFLARADGRTLAARGAAQQQLARRQRRSDALTLVLLAALALALAVPAVMPLALKRDTVIQALQHQAAVAQQAAPLQDKLDQLRQKTDILDQLHAQANTNIPLASVVDQLAAALPDDTWLNRLEVASGQIRLNGLTSNATGLISRLSRDSAFADVHATAPTVRDDSEAKDRFAFEMRWRGPDTTPDDHPDALPDPAAADPSAGAPGGEP